MKICRLNVTAYVLLAIILMSSAPSPAMNVLQDEAADAVDLSQAKWQEASAVNPGKTQMDDFMDNLHTTSLSLKGDGVASFFVKYARQFQRIESLFLEHAAWPDVGEIIQLIISDDREKFFPILHIYVRSQVKPNLLIPNMFLSSYVPDPAMLPNSPLMTDDDIAALVADYDDNLNRAAVPPAV